VETALLRHRIDCIMGLLPGVDTVAPKRHVLNHRFTEVERVTNTGILGRRKTVKIFTAGTEQRAGLSREKL